MSLISNYIQKTSFNPDTPLEKYFKLAKNFSPNKKEDSKISLNKRITQNNPIKISPNQNNKTGFIIHSHNNISSFTFNKRSKQ